MTQSQPPIPRRIVRYSVHSDLLGTYISFQTEEVELPKGVLPHRLPRHIKLQMVKRRWHFRPTEMSASIGAHQLRLLFLEFAEAMNWEAHLVDP